MGFESWYLLGLLAALLVAVYRFRVRIDLASLGLLLLLLAPVRRTDEGFVGILDTHEGFSGFGSPAVVMVGALFVLSAAMRRTGAAALLGERVLRAASRKELTLQLTVFAGVALFSAVVSDTTTVLVWIPLVLAVCRERGYAASRLLLPLAFAALLGGQWTLIGTRVNVIVSDFLRTQTGEGLGFLEFTPIAVCIFAASALYFALIGRRFLPHGDAEPSLVDRYEVTEYLTEVLCEPSSEMAGKSLEAIDLERSGVKVLGVLRGDAHLAPREAMVLEAGDVLVVQGRISRISDLLARPGVRVRDELRVGDKTLRSVDLRMVEAVVAPNSDFEGLTVSELDLHRSFGLSVLAVGRQGHALTRTPLAERLRSGDSLLVVGHEEMIERLRGDGNLLLLESRTLPVVGRSRGIAMLVWMLVVVLLAAFKLLDTPYAMLLGAVGCVAGKMIGAREAWAAIDWRVIGVLGGMIPYGLALESSGTASLLAGSIADVFRDSGPQVVFAVFLLVCIVLTQVMENSAVGIVLAPVAFELARASGADPRTFLLGTALACSAGFMTPMAHECTLLVMGPGRYEPRHYLALGFPFTLIAWTGIAFGLPLMRPL